LSDSVDEKEWLTIITSDKGRFHLGVKEVLGYKDLIFLFFKRDFTSVYKQTILGPAWFLIQPIITSIIYGFVFGNLAGLSTEGVPQYIFYFSGIIVWSFFRDILSKNSNTFGSNIVLFGKVYFPRLTVPASTILSKFLTLGIQIFIFIIFYSYFALNGMVVSLHWSLLLFPILMLQVALLATGIGLVITSMTTKYRDIRFLISFGMQLWMYATPIAYPLSEISQRVDEPFIQWVFKVNPMTFPVECFRFMVFQSNTIDPLSAAISIGLTFFFLLWGISNFNKVQKDFMDKI
jgi:lipopolysaccharide transport system permease protein